MYSGKPSSATIVIVTQNNEDSITYLLRSILKQNISGFTIDKTIVICDGSTDHTASKVSKYANKYAQISQIYFSESAGHNKRIQDVMPYINSDITILLDAEIVLKGTNFVKDILSRFYSDKISVVMPVSKPIQSRGLMAKIFMTIDSARTTFYRYSGNVHPVHYISAYAVAVRTNYLQSIAFPDSIIRPHYLYFSTIFTGYHAVLSESSTVLYHLPKSVDEFQHLLNHKTVNKKALYDKFGNLAKKEFNLPIKLKLHILSKIIIIKPLACLIYLLFHSYLLLHKISAAALNKTRVSHLNFQMKRRLSSY